MIRKKILLLAASGRYVHTHRAHLVHAARAKGYNLVVVAPGAEKYFAPPCDSISIDRANTNPLKEIATIWNLVKLYRHNKPDIVHHVGLKPALLGSVAAWLCRVPRVVHAVSGFGAALDQGLIRIIIRTVMWFFWRKSTVLVQNEVDESFVRGLAQRTIRLPGSGVNLQTFTPPAHDPPDNPLIITLASRLLWNKGVGLFVEAIKQLRAEGLSVEGWLVGGIDAVNPQAIPLEQLKAWESSITWWGERDDIAQLYQKSHIVVLPTTYREGVPKALIEAAACGRPILTTNRPGCNQVVMDGVNGFFVENVEDIKHRIRQLHQNPELRTQMGEASRIHAEKTFDEQKITQIIFDLYDEGRSAEKPEPLSCQKA